MFFNYDSIPFVVTGIIVSGLFAYSFYNIFITHNESLVNTSLNLDTVAELSESTYPILEPTNLHQIDACVQTTPINLEASVQTANIHVNTGVQTSARMWYETLKNWITELLSINSSEIQGVTPTEARVENWMSNLDSTQVVSSNSPNSVVTNLPNLVVPNDSVSNIVAEAVVKPEFIISAEHLTNLELPLHSTVANGFMNSIDTVSLALQASGYMIG